MDGAPLVAMRVLFWSLQILLLSLLLPPAAVIVIGGRVGFTEFAEFIVLACLLVAGGSLAAQKLRAAGRYVAGSVVLLLAMVPFMLFFAYIYLVAAAFRN